MQTFNEPFLKHLNVPKTPHVIVTAEDAEFDDIFLNELQAEGFNVRYLAMEGEDGQQQGSSQQLASRIHALADQMTGVSERYGIVAFGDAATAVLETHAQTQSSPRLCAIVAYYPGTIPDPARTRYPMSLSVLIHLAGEDIGIKKTQELLGIQGKRKTTRKKIAGGSGLGGELNLGCQAYRYRGVEAGFAEHDLGEFEEGAYEVAWGRSVKVLREAAGVKVDVEGIRDGFVDDLRRDPSKALKDLHPSAKAICYPTSAGGDDATSLEKFYTRTFRPTLEDLGARLVSRTVGSDRVVDELALSFRHDQEIPWLLPDVSLTGKKAEIHIVDVVAIKANKVYSESVYWDQASLLRQLDLQGEETHASKG